MSKKRSDVYFIVSATIHIALLMIFASLQTTQQGKKGGKGNPDADIIPHTQTKNVDVSYDNHSTITMKRPKPKKITKKHDKKTSKYGYWGIGVATGFGSEPVAYNGYIYTNTMRMFIVYEGYPAYNANLKDDDIIFSVDGQPMSDELNDVRGDKPKKMTLGIYRKGKIFFITIERGWIEAGTPQPENSSHP